MYYHQDSKDKRKKKRQDERSKLKKEYVGMDRLQIVRELTKLAFELTVEDDQIADAADVISDEDREVAELSTGIELDEVCPDQNAHSMDNWPVTTAKELTKLAKQLI